MNRDERDWTVHIKLNPNKQGISKTGVIILDPCRFIELGIFEL